VMIRPMAPRRISQSQAVTFVFFGGDKLGHDGRDLRSFREGVICAGVGGSHPRSLSPAIFRWGGLFPRQEPGGSRAPFGEEGP